MDIRSARFLLRLIFLVRHELLIREDFQISLLKPPSCRLAGKLFVSFESSSSDGTELVAYPCAIRVYI